MNYRTCAQGVEENVGRVHEDTMETGAEGDVNAPVAGDADDAARPDGRARRNHADTPVRER